MNSLHILLIQNTNTYESYQPLEAGLAAWSILNIIILIGSFVIAVLFVFKVLKYLNLKIKLMQRELNQ